MYYNFYIKIHACSLIELLVINKGDAYMQKTLNNKDVHGLLNIEFK